MSDNTLNPMESKKLSEQEIKELRTVGILAENWFAVSYDANSTPLAIFSEEHCATVWRDQFIATAIIEPWPMIIKDVRKGALQTLKSH